MPMLVLGNSQCFIYLKKYVVSTTMLKLINWKNNPEKIRIFLKKIPMIWNKNTVSEEIWIHCFRFRKPVISTLYIYWGFFKQKLYNLITRCLNLLRGSRGKLQVVTEHKYWNKVTRVRYVYAIWYRKKCFI